MNKLIEKLTAAGLCDGDYIHLEGMIFVDVPQFTTFFGEALDAAGTTKTARYNALKDADSNGDGTYKGYTIYFDKWLSDSLLG